MDTTLTELRIVEQGATEYLRYYLRICLDQSRKQKLSDITAGSKPKLETTNLVDERYVTAVLTRWESY